MGPHDFQRITFDTPFAMVVKPVVVMTLQNDSNESITLRMLNVDHISIDVIQTEPIRSSTGGACGTPSSNTTPSDSAYAAVNASYMSATPVSQTSLDGTTIVAGINPTNTVQHCIGALRGRIITKFEHSDE